MNIVCIMKGISGSMAVLFRYSTIFVAVIMSVLQQYMIR